MIATFTIAARDPHTGTFGVITASNFLAVGSLVPWVDAHGGIVVSQSFAHPDAAGQALANLRHDVSLEATLASFLEEDPLAKKRQIGLMNRHGESLLYDGPECTEAVESLHGEQFFVCGNMLVSGTVDAIAHAFTDARRRGLGLGDAMLKGMLAGQQHGGDKRGKLAAAMLLKRQGAGYLGSSDTLVDLRVDAAAHPLSQLRDLFSLFKLYNPHEFEHRMVELSTLSAAEHQLLDHIINTLEGGPNIDRQHPQAVHDLFARHNLAAHLDVQQQRVSSLLLSESHALLRLLRL